MAQAHSQPSWPYEFHFSLPFLDILPKKKVKAEHPEAQIILLAGHATLGKGCRDDEGQDLLRSCKSPEREAMGTMLQPRKNTIRTIAKKVST